MTAFPVIGNGTVPNPVTLTPATNGQVLQYTTNPAIVAPPNWTLVPGLFENTLWVDNIYGSDAANFAERENPLRPWATIFAAVTNALVGDCVIVRPGTHVATGNLVKNGIAIYFMPGSILTVPAAGLTPFSASGVATTYRVYGFVEIVIPVTVALSRILNFDTSTHDLIFEATRCTNNSFDCFRIDGPGNYTFNIVDRVVCNSAQAGSYAFDIRSGNVNVNAAVIQHTGPNSLNSAAVGFTRAIAGFNFNVFAGTITATNNIAIRQAGAGNVSLIKSGIITGAPGVSVTAGTVTVDSDYIYGTTNGGIVASGGVLKLIDTDVVALNVGTRAITASNGASIMFTNIGNVSVPNNVALGFSAIDISGAATLLDGNIQNIIAGTLAHAINMSAGTISLSVSEINLANGSALNLTGSNLSVVVASERWAQTGAPDATIPNPLLINMQATVAATAPCNVNVKSIVVTNGGNRLALVAGATPSTRMTFYSNSINYATSAASSFVQCTGAASTIWVVGDITINGNTKVGWDLENSTATILSSNYITMTGTGCVVISQVDTSQAKIDAYRWLLSGANSTGLLINGTNPATPAQCNLSVSGFEMSANNAIGVTAGVNSRFTYNGARILMGGTGSVGIQITSNAQGSVQMSVVEASAVGASNVRVVQNLNQGRLAWLGEVITMSGSDAVGFDFNGDAGTVGVSGTINQGTLDLISAGNGAVGLRLLGVSTANVDFNLIRVSATAGTTRCVQVAATNGNASSLRGRIKTMFNLTTPPGLGLGLDVGNAAPAGTNTGPVTVTLSGDQWLTVSERVIFWQSSNVVTANTSVIDVSKLSSSVTALAAVQVSGISGVALVPTLLVLKGGSWEALSSTVGVIRVTGGDVQLDLSQILANTVSTAAQAISVSNDLTTNVLTGRVSYINCAGNCLAFASSGSATKNMAMDLRILDQAITTGTVACVLITSPSTSQPIYLGGMYKKLTSTGGAGGAGNSVITYIQPAGAGANPIWGLKDIVIVSGGVRAGNAACLFSDVARTARIYTHGSATVAQNANITLAVAPLTISTLVL